MKNHVTKFATFALALLLSVPVVEAMTASEASAQPFRILGESRENGKRKHKLKEKKEKKEKRKRDSDKASKNNRRSRTERRTSTHRNSRTAEPQGNRYRTGRVRPSRSDQSHDDSRHRRNVRPNPNRSRATSRHTTTRTRTRTRTTTSRRTTRRTHRRSSTRRTTHVHHHHHDDVAYERADRRRGPDGYLTLGLGMGGFASPDVIDGALPGNSFNIGVGGKGRLWAAELGLNGSGYSFDPQQPGSNLSILGVSADLKLQPSLGFFEPYALIGAGGYMLQDQVIAESALGGALRLGFGADLRFNNVALSARYLFNSYAFANESGLYHGVTAQTESVGVNVTFYF